MSAILFNQRVKHGRCDFHPGVVYGFDDAEAPAYFKACGWADDTPAAPNVAISIDEIDIDPETVLRTGPNEGKRFSEVIANG